LGSRDSGGDVGATARSAAKTAAARLNESREVAHLTLEAEVTVTLCNEVGSAIARILLCEMAEGLTLKVKRVSSGKGALLNYYFARGMRNATVESELFRLPGVLATSWVQNERRWMIRLNPISAGPVCESAAAPPASQ
jgi:hypothetical protein